MRSRISSNSNKFIAMLKPGRSSYPQWKNMSLIWDMLQRAHEGTKPVKKAKRQLIEGQLDRFIMLDDDDPQEMYNRLKKLVNKVKAYGSRRWGDRRVIDGML
jgi:hypothetical protein